MTGRGTVTAIRERTFETHSSLPASVAMFAVPAAATFLRFVPVVRRMLEAGDFPAHIRLARAMAEQGSAAMAHHPGFHLVVAAVHAIVPGAGWERSALWVIVGGLVAAALILVAWIRRAVPAGHRRTLWLAAALLPVALLTVQPALPWGPLARDPWLFGYFPANQLHTPTTMFSKPFALALFAFGMRAVHGSRAGRGAIALCAGVVIASALVKPSFLIAFAPALGLMAIARRQQVNWIFVACGFVAPALILLGVQYLARYGSGDGVSVQLAPLLVLGLYGAPTDAATLLLRLVASVLLPLAAVAFFPRAALRDPALRLAWLTFACGAAYAYLLAEGGGQADHGNFLWSGQLAAFVLFAVTVMFVLRQLVAAAPGKDIWLRGGACAALLAWHVASGVRHLQSSWYA